MVRFRSAALIVALVVFPLACSPSSNKRVLFILVDKSDNMGYMLTNEVGVIVSMLEKAGYKVVTASESGKPLKGSKITLKPDLKFADVKIEDYAGVMIPSLATPLDFPRPKGAVEIVKQAAASGKPIAVQVSGWLILYYAGLATEDKHFVNVGDGVAEDGNIITSGIDPYIALLYEVQDGTVELTQKFIDQLASQR